MIDPALAYLYFGLPTTVGLLGLAAMKLHERSALPMTETADDLDADGIDRLAEDGVEGKQSRDILKAEKEAANLESEQTSTTMVNRDTEGRRGEPLTLAGRDQTSTTSHARSSATVGLVLKNKDNSIGSVEPGASVLEIAQILSSRRIGAVLVLDDSGGVVGIVTERDVVKALATHSGEVIELRAEDLMTRNVTMATSQTTVNEAMEIMDAGYFRHLPVVNNGRLEGIISIRDLVNYSITMHERDAWNMKEYIVRPA